MSEEEKFEGDGDADDRPISGRRCQKVEDEEGHVTLKCPHASCGHVFTPGASMATIVRAHFRPKAQRWPSFQVQTVRRVAGSCRHARVGRIALQGIGAPRFRRRWPAVSAHTTERERQTRNLPPQRH